MKIGYFLVIGKVENSQQLLKIGIFTDRDRFLEKYSPLNFNPDDFIPDELNVDSRGRKRKKKHLRPIAIPSVKMGSNISAGELKK